MNFESSNENVATYARKFEVEGKQPRFMCLQ